jgi:hypothetical protein
LAATAAAVAVGVGIWAVSGPKRPQQEVVAARHELLRKVVAHNAALAQTGDPKARLAKLTELTDDLRGETKDIIHAAPKDDLASLAGMFEKVVTDGLIQQAKSLNRMTMTPAEYQAILTATAQKLEAAENDANELLNRASPLAKPELARIAKAAANGRSELLRLAHG